ncbi:MAG: amidohydrolase family protein [Bryobacteraceae bacterium]
MNVAHAFTCAALAVILAAPASAQTKRIRPPSEPLLIKCKLLINPADGTTIPDAAIQVNNGKILRAGRAADFPALPGYRAIDFSTKYIIPGLVDLHAHMYGGVQFRSTTNENGPILLLAAGVTTACGPGSMDPGGDLAMRNRIDSGFWIGPRYFLAGEYLEMDPVTVRWMNPLFTPEEARLKIDHWATEGISAIKLYARMNGEIMRVAVDHAHEHGLRVMAHVGATTYKDAIEMGVDELFHGVLALPDAYPPDLDPKDTARREQITESLDFSQPKFQEIFRLAAERKVVLTPTAVVREPLLMDKQHMQEQKRFFAPSTWERILKVADQPVSPAVTTIMDKQRQFINAAYKAGCMLGTGTDYVVWRLLHGYSLWREMDIFAEAGLPPMAILKAATFNGAYAIGRTDQLGSVDAGKLADFVVLDANPLDNIGNVRSVHRVVKNGIIYDPEELRKMVDGKIY